MTVIRSVGIALMVAAIWGYFADLSVGQVGWFIGRLLFGAAVAMTYCHRFGRQSDRAPESVAGKSV
jgi:hypothetical protein